MENKKCILVFILTIIFLLVMVSFVQATDENPLQIINNTQTPTTAVTPTDDEEPNTVVDNDTTTPIIGNSTTDNNDANNTLPQTGVEESTTLFIFIGVCIVSAIYAFIKIRNYKNI